MNSDWGNRGRGVQAQQLRCSDAERESAIERLKQAFGEGRLDGEELDMRVHLAMTAKTRGELAASTHDLDAHSVPAVPLQPTGEDRMLAGLAHASGYFTTFLGPLLFLLLSGKRSEYVRQHATEALNFQLTVLLVVVVTFGVGGLLYFITWILCAIAALAAIAGGSFRYPLTLRLIK